MASPFVRRNAPLLVLVVAGALSLALLRWSYVEVRERTRVALAMTDNLHQARLHVLTGYLASERAAGGDETAGRRDAVAHVDRALLAASDWAGGRNPAFGVEGRPAPDPELRALVQEYERRIAAFRAAVLRAVRDGAAGQVELRRRFADTEATAGRIERRLYRTLREMNRRQERVHLLMLGGWCAFLVLLAAAVHRVGAARERTAAALRESETRFRQIAENIQDVFWMRDEATGTVPYVSPAYARLWGRPPEEVQSSPSRWLEGVHPDDRERVEKRLQVSGVAFDETYRIVRPDGTVRWVRDRSFPVVDAANHVSRTVGIASDISELREAEERRRTLEAQLRQAQKMEALGTLAGGIAHDFNNILTVVMGHTQLAQLDVEPETPVGEALQEVLRASQRAKLLVQRILTFSRGTEAARVPVRIAPLVEEATRFIKAAIPSTVEVRFHADAAAPCVVLADPSQLHQVVMNLGVNAAQAMPRGGTLEVRVEQKEVEEPDPEWGLAPGRYVCLSLRDTGTGMKPEVMERMFEPFFTTKPPGEGTGLGLAVVHGIIQTHGGALRARSRPGEGTVFEVYLPVHAPATSAASPVPQPAVPGGRAERILLVDDEPGVLAAGRRMLEHLGYEVASAGDGLEALARVQTAPEDFDLVLTDHTMPRMTGTALAQALRELRPDLPVVLTTGLHLPEQLPPDLARIEVVQKPFDLRTLGTAVRRALEGASTREGSARPAGHGT